MTFAADLRAQLESEETLTVGGAFGGTGASGGSYTVGRIKQWVLENYGPYATTLTVGQILRSLADHLSVRVFQGVIANAIRYAFLIELTNLKVGSTKMKTRWLRGYILMPQPDSFEPVPGVFEAGNDPRAAAFEECYAVFERVLTLTLERISLNANGGAFLKELQDQTRVPYEFLVGYVEPAAEPVHRADNVTWIENEDIAWLVKARGILRRYHGEHSSPIRQLGSKKLQVKVYKTDRALTGKDKTNRAKRWELLFGDFQFATLAQCWSVERKLTGELMFFQNFPPEIREEFIAKGLVTARDEVTRCPITLAPLDFLAFADALRNATHGRSDYQVGHLIPLKRRGQHIGTNIAWQSADGNRIQGDLTLEETVTVDGNRSAEGGGCS